MNITWMKCVLFYALEANVGKLSVCDCLSVILSIPAVFFTYLDGPSCHMNFST